MNRLLVVIVGNQMQFFAVYPVIDRLYLSCEFFEYILNMIVKVICGVHQ